jgi:hypothetical protein
VSRKMAYHHIVSWTMAICLPAKPMTSLLTSLHDELAKSLFRFRLFSYITRIWSCTSAVVMKPTVYQVVLLACILEKKMECVSSCGSGQYYSDDIPGCVGCPANCDDQDARDKERCKEACGRCHL